MGAVERTGRGPALREDRPLVIHFFALERSRLPRYVEYWPSSVQTKVHLGVLVPLLCAIALDPFVNDSELGSVSSERQPVRDTPVGPNQIRPALDGRDGDLRL